VEEYSTYVIIPTAKRSFHFLFVSYFAKMKVFNDHPLLYNLSGNFIPLPFLSTIWWTRDGLGFSLQLGYQETLFVVWKAISTFDTSNTYSTFPGFPVLRSRISPASQIAEKRKKLTLVLIAPA